MAELAGKSSTHDLALRCIACGEFLNFLADFYPLVFHCRKGHFFSLRDLLDELLSGGRVPSESLVIFWEKKIVLLRKLASRALHSGHPFLAADFQESAERVREWVTKLKSLVHVRHVTQPVAD